MISAGNDIVSLTATNVTRTKSPEFYQKIISPAEKALFETLDQAVLPFDRFVWLLWSVKESAYKYLHRIDPGIVFTPVKFEIRSIDVPADHLYLEYGGDEISAAGFSDFNPFNVKVVFRDKILYAKVVLNDEFVSSVVHHTDHFENIYWGIKRVSNTAYTFQSHAVREFALDAIREFTGLNNPAIAKNEDEIPVLLNDGELTTIPLSLSHHGQWVAFSVYSPLSTRC